jgi:hypothetical protein
MCSSAQDCHRTHVWSVRARGLHSGKVSKRSHRAKGKGLAKLLLEPAKRRSNLLPAAVHDAKLDRLAVREVVHSPLPEVEPAFDGEEVNCRAVVADRPARPARGRIVLADGRRASDVRERGERAECCVAARDEPV